MAKLRQQSMDFSVYVDCDLCGGEIEMSFDGDTITVTPCEKCMDEKYNEGVKDGMAAP